MVMIQSKFSLKARKNLKKNNMIDNKFLKL